MSNSMFLRSSLPMRKLSAQYTGSAGRSTVPSRRTLALQANKDFKLSKMTTSQQTSVSVDSSSTNPPSVVPTVMGGIAFVTLALFLYKKSSGLREKLPWSKRSRDLKAIKAMNDTENDCLSDEAVSAARSRRSKERANHKINLEDVELPENHPWATRQQVTKEQEKTVHTRLNLRRSVPPQQQPSSRDAEPGSRQGRTTENDQGGIQRREAM